MRLGMTQLQADGSNFRGTNQGTQLKSGGSSGLNIPLAGYRVDISGAFAMAPTTAYWWTSTESGSSARDRYMNSVQPTVGRMLDSKGYGFSVRCLAN